MLKIKSVKKKKESGYTCTILGEKANGASETKRFERFFPIFAVFSSAMIRILLINASCFSLSVQFS